MFVNQIIICIFVCKSMREGAHNKPMEVKLNQSVMLKLSKLEANKGQIPGLPKNPRVIKDEKFKKLVKSIEENPEMTSLREILVYPYEGKYVVIGGNMRLKAMKELGYKEAPCKVIAEDTTVEQLQAYTIKDNSGFGEWDFDMLTSEWDLGLLTDCAIDLPEISIEEPEAEVKEDDFSEEEAAQAESRVQRGDIWRLGEHRLMCGDSTDAECVKALMGGQMADMVFTDPPYNVAFNGRSGKFEVIKNDDLEDAEFNSFITKVCKQIKQLTPKCYYIWCNWKFYGVLQKQMEYKSCIVWAKNVFGLGKGYRHQHEFCLFNGSIDEGVNNESDLWEIAKDSKYVHPTQKPIALCARALKNHAIFKNVVDLFGGSGSTIMACEELKRKCFTMELDEHYCDVIIARWEKLTGKKAEKIN